MELLALFEVVALGDKDQAIGLCKEVQSLRHAWEEDDTRIDDAVDHVHDLAVLPLGRGCVHELLEAAKEREAEARGAVAVLGDRDTLCPVEVFADLGGGVLGVIKERDEGRDGLLEEDVVLPKGVVGVEEKGRSGGGERGPWRCGGLRQHAAIVTARHTNGGLPGVPAVCCPEAAAAPSGCAKSETDRAVRMEWRTRFRSQQGRAVLLHTTLLLLLAAFFASYFNRFAGLRSGDGEFTGGIALLAGRLPYRDYFTAGPPLNALKSALLLWVFGPMLVVSRVAGVVERLILALILFRWLRQMTAPAHALVATLVAVILSAGDRTDPIASYNHDCILWAMAGGLAASCALRPGSVRRVVMLAAASGVCAAMSLLTKQTVGAGAVLCLWVVPALLLRGAVRAGTKEGSVSPALVWLPTFGLGVALPVAAVAGVLFRLGVLHAALQMLFVIGPSAKAGHPGDFVVRTALVASDNLGWISLGLFWVLLAWRPLRRRLLMRDGAGVVSGEWPVAGWLARLAGVGALLLTMAEVTRTLPALHDASKSVVYAVELALLLVVVWLGQVWRRSDSAVSLVTKRLVLLTAMSVVVALLLSLSWPAFEAMLLPGVGLVTALVLEGSVGWRQRRVVFAVLGLLVLLQMREKLDLPFGFDLEDEGRVSEAVVPSTLPALKGMKLPAATVAFVDATTELIRGRTCDSETVFVYPEMSLLYSLAGRGWPTWSPSHNIDVVNDALAREEAGRVLRARPAVLVEYVESEADLRGAERLWRRGGNSGQRAMAAAVAQLAREYREAGRYVLRPGDPPVTVWVRPDVWARPPGFCASGRVP